MANLFLLLHSFLNKLFAFRDELVLFGIFLREIVHLFSANNICKPFTDLICKFFSMINVIKDILAFLLNLLILSNELIECLLCLDRLAWLLPNHLVVQVELVNKVIDRVYDKSLLHVERLLLIIIIFTGFCRFTIFLLFLVEADVFLLLI